MIIDSHCHLYDEKLDNIRDKIIENLEKTGQVCICSSDNIESSKKSIFIANSSNNIYATIGTHPHCANQFKDKDLQIYKNLSKNKKVVAIGEIGLDYFYDYSPRDIQKEVLIKQIKLACELSLPCVFHVRDAIQDFLEIVKNNKQFLNNSALIHSFSGSIEVAKILLNLDFYFSFNGIITFKNANKILEVVKFIPIDRILIETDSPYLTPVPYRGDINRPEYVELVAEKIAVLKNLSKDEVINITTNNAKKFFRL